MNINHSGHLAELEHLLGGGGRKQVHAPCDDAGPADLLAEVLGRGKLMGDFIGPLSVSYSIWTVWATGKMIRTKSK
jgi:hypothetical protein